MLLLAETFLQEDEVARYMWYGRNKEGGRG